MLAYLLFCADNSLPAGHYLGGLGFVEAGVEGVEVFAIKVILSYAQGFAEAGRLK